VDKNKNYYSILGISHDSDSVQIKKAYYKLSYTLHPDRGGDPILFSEISEAYSILNSDLRIEYDKRSKWGKDYNEYQELFDINYEFDFNSQKTHFETFKKNEVNNIKIVIGDDFDGTLQYERWVKCKSCDGTGKDLTSKIVIKDINGNIVKSFDAEDGCDFCEGTGKFENFDCTFCSGKGKVGLNHCTNCGGERRILGKQKIANIKLTGHETKLESMGHHSKNESGKVGYLLIVKSTE
jgi:DnaJ family protein A protein 2